MKRTILSLALLLIAGGVVVAAEEGAGKEEAAEQRTTLWKLANFSILAVVAGYFIYKKGGGFFAARGTSIRKELDQAAQVRKEAEARYMQMEERLKNLGSAVEALRAEARKETATEGARVRQDNERELGKIRLQAEQEIAGAGKAARQDLRAYAAELAVRLAGETIRGQLTPQTDGELVRAMVSDLGRRASGQAERI